MGDERGQGVQAVRTKIAQGDMGSVGVEDFFHAGCCVSRIALKDKVMPVFFDGLDLCKLLLGDFVVKQEVSQYKITGAIDMLVPSASTYFDADCEPQGCGWHQGTTRAHYPCD